MNTVTQEQQSQSLSQHIVKVVRQYLSSNSSKDADLNLYEIVLEEIEINLKLLAY